MAVCWKAADAGKRRRGLRLAAAGHRLASGAPAAVAGPRFVIVTLAGQALAIAIPAIVVDLGGWPAHAATLAVCVACPAVSFILNSSFVFADRRDARSTS